MKLNEINDFTEYVFELFKNAENYVVFVTSSDAHVPPNRINRKLEIMNSLGIKTDLQQTYRYSFITIVDGGEVKFEQSSEREKLETDYEFLGHKAHVMSQGFNSMPMTNSPVSVIIDNAEYAISKRGLNFVIWDKSNNTVADSVVFDTFFKGDAVRKDYAGQSTTLDQINIIKLRDCFYAGYSMPQYCVDNGIKNPLIASYDPEFLWEMYVQFRYDKRVFPKLCIISGKETFISYGGIVIEGCKFEHLDFGTIEQYDKVIILTCEKFANLPANKTVYLDSLLGQISLYVYYERPLYEYIYQHPDIKVIVGSANILRNDKNTSEYEKKILGKNIHALRHELEVRGDRILETRYDRFGYTNDEVKALLTLSNSKTDPDGSTELLDNDHPLVRIHDNKRETAYQPETYKNKIYFVGSCTFGGIGAAYDRTMESCLQQLLNQNDMPYCVENYFQLYNGRYQDIFYNLYKLPVKKGDIIILYLNMCKVKNVPYLDVSKLFERPHEYGEVFTDRFHINETGYKIVAEKIYEYLTENNFFKDHKYDIPTDFPSVHQYGIISGRAGGGIISQYQEELEQYKLQLRTLRPAVGSIVMNCNPFTLGHRYLAEYAASRVERLYIFVVEEDKSIFPFADRIELVKNGTADLKNVTVLPSGKFIISALTFSGYFNKAELQDSTVDPSMDVELFGKEIAPQLGITVRFAGEEPLDNVTRQYNETMARILPKYGVAFEVIPRKEQDGGVISASRVRKLLDDNNFEEIQKLVPDTTFRYLINKFKNN